MQGLRPYDHEDDDALIEPLIGAARDHLEQATGRTFVATTYKLTLDEFPDNEILLPHAVRAHCTQNY